MSQIRIWPLRKTWLSTWWQNPWWQSQRSDVSCSQPPGLHTSQEGFCPTLLCRSSPSHYITRFRGWRLAARTFGSLHRFSMRLRSGDWLGHCHSWCQRAWVWSHLTTTLSPSSPQNHWQTSDGPLLSWAGGPYGCCSISVIHSVVCYQMFSLWPWSQLPWYHWQDPSV